uniref:Uncharacterized protein n=1 Tax=Oryza barthii TaxID=65489 RepID=A0A0D3HG08_9ORYZ
MIPSRYQVSDDYTQQDDPNDFYHVSRDIARYHVILIRYQTISTIYRVILVRYRMIPTRYQTRTATAAAGDRCGTAAVGDGRGSGDGGTGAAAAGDGDGGE